MYFSQWFIVNVIIGYVHDILTSLIYSIYSQYRQEFALLEYHGLSSTYMYFIMLLLLYLLPKAMPDVTHKKH